MEVKLEKRYPMPVEPLRSAPLPSRRMRRAASSMPPTVMSPPKAAVAGPTLTLTVPL